jgi:hypothetical protein
VAVVAAIFKEFHSLQEARSEVAENNNDIIPIS